MGGQAPVLDADKLLSEIREPVIPAHGGVPSRDSAGWRIPVKPLRGCRIASLEQYGAGPFGSVQLADLGADVLEIENPATGGDIGRHAVPMQEDENSLLFETCNRTKRSIDLDITTDAGRAVLAGLVKGSDIIDSNFRGDVPAKPGIRYVVKHLNPAIICGSLSGFEMTEPRSAELGYDYVLQGMAGWMELTGEPDGPPTKSGLSLVDYSDGLVAAISIFEAVHAAWRNGVGADCDGSLFDTAISMLIYPAAWTLNSDFVHVRTHHSAHPSLVPFQAFPTASGWLLVACLKEKLWMRLAGVFGQPEITGTERFDSFKGRRETLTLRRGHARDDGASPIRNRRAGGQRSQSRAGASGMSPGAPLNEDAVPILQRPSGYVPDHVQQMADVGR